ncbi:MAG: pilus assembly protein [Gammaproteobacteria bacterium]|nr:pilus assembly protein [Gammaproteobacteria bacterium]
MSLHRQKGTSLVEMALVLVLFLVIIFAVIEFSIAIVRSAQLAEATRNGVRYAVVNDPLTGLSACTSAGVVATINCDSGSCPDLIERMAGIAPIINIQDDINVEVEYACPDSTYIERNDIYLVTVTVSGAKHYLTVPGILGWGLAINLQSFRSTKISEDLHTAAVSGG